MNLKIDSSVDRIEEIMDAGGIESHVRQSIQNELEKIRHENGCHALGGKELAQVVSASLNCSGFKSHEFCEMMRDEHKTLQQSFMRLIRDYMEYVTDMPDYCFDGRNEASKTFAKAATEATENITLPFI